MCGYDQFWILEERLEQEYLERMEEETKLFVKELKYKTDKELSQLLWDAEEMQDGLMQKKVIEEINRRLRNA